MSDIKRSQYKPRSYRYGVPFHFMFESLADIYSESKSLLFYRLIRDKIEIDIERIDALPIYRKNQLLEIMLDQLKNVGKLSHHELMQHERIKEIESYFYTHIQHSFEDERPLKPFRILPEYQNFIKDYANKNTDRLGEVIELAISLHIKKLSELEYRFFLIVFKDMVQNEAAKE